MDHKVNNYGFLSEAAKGNFNQEKLLLLIFKKPHSYSIQNLNSVPIDYH